MAVEPWCQLGDQLGAGEDLVARQQLAVDVEDLGRDGSEFEISPVRAKSSPLDVEGVDVGVSAEEIVSVVREMRVRQAVEQ